MSSRASKIAECIDLQHITYDQVATSFTNNVKEFHGKGVRLAYCCELVNDDLDELYYKRHFNFQAGLMALSPDPENTIPLRVCMYFEKLPVAYAMGDINDEDGAFELHFIETSNFFGNTGLKGWMKYLVDILLALKSVLDCELGIQVDKLCVVNPAQNTRNALIEMGFDFTHDYKKSNSAAILYLNTADICCNK